MTILWTKEEIIDVLDARVQGDFNITGLCINTRMLEKGDAYIALQGVSKDGHVFIEDAFEKGASAALVRHDYQVPANLQDKAFIFVKDPFEAMYTLAKAARKRSNAKIIGLTGSVGKTSTRQMLSLVFERFGKTSFSKGGYNNHWGLPLSVASLAADADYGVFEMGMNHAGEITPLTALAKPDIAIITNVEKVHLEHFENFEGIAEAKAEIFKGVQKGGTAILNRDNVFYDFLTQKARAEGIENIVSFGRHENADVKLLNLDISPQKSDLDVDAMGEKVSLTLHAPGAHMAMNALAVLAAVKVSGRDVHQAAKNLADFKPVSGRGVQQDFSFKGGLIHVVDESYNASFVAIKAALNLLKTRPLNGGRHIVVLGDMLELGDESEAIHLDLKDVLLDARTDLFFAIGPMMTKLYDTLPAEKQGGFGQNVEALMKTVQEKLQPGDILLVKGSRRWQLEKLIDTLTLRKAV